MCDGPTRTQTELQQEEADFYQNQIQAYNTAYANFAGINKTLQAQFAPVINAGIGQFGYTPAETTALRTEATQGTGTNYNAAQRALQENIAATGGGTAPVNMTSGPAAELKEQLASSAAQEESSENLGITTSGYDIGRQQYLQAIQGEEALAASWNPNTFSQSTVNAGNATASEANTIAARQGSFWNSVIGALGGVAGAAAGNFKMPGTSGAADASAVDSAASEGWAF